MLFNSGKASSKVFLISADQQGLHPSQVYSVGPIFLTEFSTSLKSSEKSPSIVIESWPSLFLKFHPCIHTFCI